MSARIPVIAAAIAIIVLMCAPQAVSHSPAGPVSIDPKGKPPPSQATVASPSPYQDWPRRIGIHNTNAISASFNCLGQVGSGFGGGSANNSFNVFDEDTAKYLFGGALWIGGVVNGDTIVTTAHDGWRNRVEVSSSAYPDPNAMTRILSPVSNAAYRAESIDTVVTWFMNDPDDLGRPHQPLGLHIANRSHSWIGDEAGRVIVYDMVLTNIGRETIESGYVGMYIDADVGAVLSQSHVDDLAGYVQDSAIAYIIDNDGDYNVSTSRPVLRAMCLKLLASSTAYTDTSFNWWINHADPGLNFGPRHIDTRPWPFEGSGTPLTDTIKYYLMSNREIDYDQALTPLIQPNDPLWEYPNQDNVTSFGGGMDTRFVYSFGPFELTPGNSERVLFATFAPDTVHVDPDNGRNLNADPETFVNNLDRDAIRRTGWVADTLAEKLLDPTLPPAGIVVRNAGSTSVNISWDPWVFPEVTGYSVVYGEVDPDQLARPGTPPPWLNPLTYDSELIVDSGERNTLLQDLNPNTCYFFKVAHVTANGTGNYCPPVFLHVGGRKQPPEVADEFALYPENSFVTLSWAPPDEAVAHFNIYRLDHRPTETDIFHPFYDSGAATAYIEPVEQIVVNADTFFFYQLEPYLQAAGTQTAFPDLDPEDGSWYVITAVAPDGFESDFSIRVEAVAVPPRTKDVLVVTHSNIANPMMNWDAVRSFYDSILSGLDYAIYDWADSVGKSSNGLADVDWHAFMEYDLIIVDDDLSETALNRMFEDSVRGYTKAILSGSRLAYFGSLGGLNWDYDIARPPAYYRTDHPFVQRFFPGVDSSFAVGAGYFIRAGLPLVDTLFGFARAMPVAGSYAGISFDPSHSPLSAFAQQLWPPGTPPGVSVFAGAPTEYVTHLAEVLPGIESPLRDAPVGLRFESPMGEPLFLFGFHLWYMNQAESRNLIYEMLGRSCCEARGNANGHMDGPALVSVADLTYLIDHFFRSGPGPACTIEADVNADHAVNISDLIYLVDFFYRTGPEPPPCPD